MQGFKWLAPDQIRSVILPSYALQSILPPSNSLGRAAQTTCAWGGKCCQRGAQPPRSETVYMNAIKFADCESLKKLKKPDVATDSLKESIKSKWTHAQLSVVASEHIQPTPSEIPRV